MTKRQSSGGTPNGCFQDAQNGNVYGVSLSGLPANSPAAGTSAEGSTADASIDFWTLSNTFVTAGLSQCAPAIEAPRIELPANCPPMSKRVACEANIGFFIPDNQTLGNSDAFFHCMAMAGAELVSLPEDAQANGTCPTTFPAVQQFAGLPSLNPGQNNGTSIDPNPGILPAPGIIAPAHQGPGAGVIAGAVIAAVAGSVLLVAGGLYLLRKKRGTVPAAGDQNRGVLPLTLVSKVLGHDATASTDASNDAPNFRRSTRTRHGAARHADDAQSLRRSSRIPVRPVSIAESSAPHDDLEQGFELQAVTATEIV